jgi:hypothetical protein
LDRVEADAAGTERDADRAGLDLGGVAQRARAGHHAAADQRAAIERHVVDDLDHAGLVQRRLFGHHAARRHHIQRQPLRIARARCPPGKVATEVVPMSHSCGRPVTQWRQRPQLATKLVTTGRSW